MMNAYIKSISYYLPEKIFTNEELVKEFPEWSVEKVTAKIGIEERHIAAENETAGDMAVKAGEKLFAEHHIDPQSIDFLLFCTQSPDYFLPATSCILQNKLGIPTTAGALDYNQGCSGYIYGLSLAKGLIAGGIAKNILLLTGETYHKYMHPLDKGNKSIFGDAATATLISTEGLAKIGDFTLGTNGEGAENLIVKTGASRHKKSMSENDQAQDENGTMQSPDYLYMNGSEIFNFTLDVVPPLVNNTLDKNHLKKEDIDLFVFHQANKFVINTLRKICGISPEYFYVNLSSTGNTISNSIPLAMKQALDSGIIREGMSILLAGFGVGYSWGATVIKF